MFVILPITWWADRSLAGQEPNPAAAAADKHPETAFVLKLKPEAAGDHRYQVCFGAPSGARAATDPVAPALVTVNGGLLTRVRSPSR